MKADLIAAVAAACCSPESQAAATAAIKAAFITGYRWAMGLAGAMAFVSALVALRFVRRPAVQGPTG